MNTTTKTSGQWWETRGDSVTVSLDAVRSRAIALLVASGASAEDAAFIVDVHVDKALQGDHERGIAMLAGEIRAAQVGDLDLRARIEVRRDHGATGLVGAGPKASHKLVCREAMALAIRKAQAGGVGCVGAQAYGQALTPFIEQAVREGMVVLVLAQSLPTVAPHGGTQPLLGNAPIGWGVPAGRNAPVIVDMSLTQTSAKGVVRAAEQGDGLPPGFLLDANGNPSTKAADFADPAWLEKGKFVARGSLATLGGSHKSYALVFVVGLLASVLTGTDFAWELGQDNTGPRRFGTLFVVLDPKAFGEPQDVLDRVDAYIDHVRSSPRREGVEAILYPGERSGALKQNGRTSGLLTLPAAHLRALEALGSHA